MTVRDVLEQTLRKRALRSNVEYVLELQGNIGHELDLTIELEALHAVATMDRNDKDKEGNSMRFLLVQKHSTT